MSHELSAAGSNDDAPRFPPLPKLETKEGTMRLIAEDHRAKAKASAAGAQAALEEKKGRVG